MRTERSILLLDGTGVAGEVRRVLQIVRLKIRLYRGADKSLAGPSSRCILFDD